jgi:tetratricopeptide (TPR) repeat protein
VGLGPYARRISSSNPEAQAFFNQGMQMMFAFAKSEAVRSFRQSWANDPACAICYWGEAWAWGSYLNAPMSAVESPWAHAAAQRALALRERASPVERALIEAIAVRYVPKFDPQSRRDQDEAYAEAMREVAERFPEDLDVLTLYGEALFLLEPRRGERDAETPAVRRMLEVFDRVLATDIRHPGACHLYVHATEATQFPERAAGCAEFLGDAIPGASHINHMPSHTWTQIGRWGDAVRANIQAWHSDLKAAVGEGFAIYPSHNLHMLAFAASMDGQGAIAIQAGKDYAKLMGGDTMFHALTLVRFGRFDEIASVPQPTNSDVSLGLWEFAQGYACLRREDRACAERALARVREIGDKSPAMFRFHSARVLLGAVGGILEGEMARAAGDLPGAIRAFERAVGTEDELIWDEPEPLPFAARHWLGAALLDAGRPADAVRVYRSDLDRHPHNGWALLGLQQALSAQGIRSPEVDADLAHSWARSDTWIRSSRF